MDERIKEKPPAIKVIPPLLDFGLVDLSQLKHNRSSVLINITNTGGGIMRARLVPQVGWIQGNLEEFHLSGEQTVEREIKLASDFPRHWNKRKYTFDSMLMVNSSGGSVTLGGTYMTIPGQTRQRFSNAWILAIIGIVLAGLIAIPILARYVFGRTMNEVQIDPQLYYTQGALTAYAALTSTSQFAATRTYTPALESERTTVFLLQRTKAREVTATYTAWPRDKFANPEQFIRDYYAGLNKRQYTATWRMLSTKFQQDCCIVAGNDPFSVYSAYWDGVDKVEVVYAYLQQWDSNPAIVNVGLKYLFKRGDKTEGTYVFNLISDSETQTLLIDVVK